MLKRCFSYWYVWVVPVIGGLLGILLLAKLDTLPKRVAVPGAPLSISVPSEWSWQVNYSTGRKRLELVHVDAKIHVVSGYRAINALGHSITGERLLHSKPVVIQGHKVLVQLQADEVHSDRYLPIVDRLVDSLRHEVPEK